MKVRTTRPTFVGGEPVKVGKIIEVTEVDGRNLIAGGKAVPVDVVQNEAPDNRAVGGAGDSTRE